jgi:hypothetical protein
LRYSKPRPRASKAARLLALVSFVSFFLRKEAFV